MKSLLRLLLKTQLKTNFSKVNRTVGGFTLLELLIAMIMTFLILTPLLAFVVDILNTDRKEQVKSNTEQEIQASLDFIAQDLGQAVYIYDNEGINTGTENIGGSLPGASAGTPILVFWKRQLLKKVLPTLATATNCTPNDPTCNDTYVYSLVAYYLKQDTNAIWCQPAGGTCPARITRYQIQDGVFDPRTTTPTYLVTPTPNGSNVPFPVFSLSLSGANLEARMNQWPRQEDNGAKAAVAFPGETVLVNYVDTSAPVAIGTECQQALGNPTDQSNQPIPENKLRVADATKIGFYACVDSSKTVARVFIRGNAMRKMQNNAPYSSANAAFFPTASIQVQGLSELAQ